jgi:hypothetical protein
VAGFLLVTAGAGQAAWATDPAPAPAQRPALLGGALPGGAVISAAVSSVSVGLAPVAGGPATLAVDDAALDVEVGPDGVLAGQVAAR